ncbi:hypothetical protein [Streptosporangium longisporum]|uniref:hypothetical protein n=1 Tax=Streptosporangium longisporum TaxID=46187 RepID=UPI0039A61FC8
MDDPTRVWRHIFDNQLTEKERILLATLFSLGGDSLLEEIREALLHRADWDVSQVRRSLQILDGTFIKVYHEQSHQYVEFSNPSVNDFVIRKMRDETGLLRNVLLNAHSFDQVANIWFYHPDANTCASNYFSIDLRHLSCEIEKSALSTLEASNISARKLVGHLATALEISDKLGLTRLGEHVATYLSKQGCIYGGQHEDIAYLIRKVADSPNAHIRKHHKAVLMEGLTALFNRDRRNKGLFIAAIYAHRLAEFVDERVLHDIDDQAAARADHLMELQEFGSPDEEIDDEELVSALEYMSIFSNFHDRWPGAGEIMDDRGLNFGDYSDEEEGDEEGDPKWTDGLIYTIMSFLKRADD